MITLLRPPQTRGGRLAQLVERVISILRFIDEVFGSIPKSSTVTFLDVDYRMTCRRWDL